MDGLHYRTNNTTLLHKCIDNKWHETSQQAIDLTNSKLSCKSRAFLRLNAGFFSLCWDIKDEVRLKQSAADSGSVFRFGERRK